MRERKQERSSEEEDLEEGRKAVVRRMTEEGGRELLRGRMEKERDR